LYGKIVQLRCGQVAGNARKEIEHKTGKKVTSKKNFLPKQEKGKILKKKNS
jgi:hypothetical protein